jgi:hypothetical protein
VTSPRPVAPSKSRQGSGGGGARRRRAPGASCDVRRLAGRAAAPAAPHARSARGYVDDPRVQSTFREENCDRSRYLRQLPIYCCWRANNSELGACARAKSTLRTTFFVTRLASTSRRDRTLRSRRRVLRSVRRDVRVLVKRMVRNAIRVGIARLVANAGDGRVGRRVAPPAPRQIRTCGFPASGSSLSDLLIMVGACARSYGGQVAEGVSIMSRRRPTTCPDVESGGSTTSATHAAPRTQTERARTSSP